MSELSVDHLLGIKYLKEDDLHLIFETADHFKEVINRKIKKVPTLRDLTIANLFFENSTRTKLSFELAEKRLSADVINFSESPNIDKLANEGMLFHNAYAAPVCSATRASILSGQYPTRVGIFDFIPGHWRPYEEVTVPIHETTHLSEDVNTIGDAMQSAGYKTAYFGKWHLGHLPEFLPQSQGFDSYFGIPYSNDMHLCSRQNTKQLNLIA